MADLAAAAEVVFSTYEPGPSPLKEKPLAAFPFVWSQFVPATIINLIEQVSRIEGTFRVPDVALLQ